MHSGGPRLIDPVFLDTLIYRREGLEPRLGCAVDIEPETTKPVGSFKGRGTGAVASLLADAGRRGGGVRQCGHVGQTRVWSGRARGLDVTVVVSRSAAATKLDRIRAQGATREPVDGDDELARERAASLARNEDIRLLEDSLDLKPCEAAGDHPLGAGELRSAGRHRCACPRGGLATGVGHVLQELAPHVEVVCVQALGARALA
ncbi:PLP-dependent lyase/thiolase [Streptomyces albidoflavus]|uniref:pyridoxal-phosphate dependent enzyme n=1 Tax=Streptomyces albidoflavus TaxID=1886 RepID=UPI003086148D|nr:PLP-dependent lyase/thiolase [Streptomyces albidoflavus]